MKKKLAILLGISILALSLAGCGGGSDTGGDTGGDTSSDAGTEKVSDEAAKLVIAARGGSHVDVIEAIKGDFEKENNVTIEVLGLEAADLKQKVSLDAKNKKGSYDLMMLDDPWMPEITGADMLLNLTEAGYEDDADFVNASLSIGKVPYGEGDTFALPFAGNVQLLFYNKSVLESANAQVPETWEDVLAIAEAVHGKDDKVGYVIRGQQGNPIVTDYLPLLWAYGGDVFDEDWSVTVDSDAAKESLAMYMELLDNGVNYEKNDIVAAVSDGKAAMSLGWPSWYISSEGATSEYAEIPNKASESSESYPTGMIGNWMMGVTKNSQNPELAMKFLQYVTSAEAQKIATEHGGVPTRKSVFTDQELSGKYPYFETLLVATENSVVRPRTPLWSDVETVYGAELSSAISGTKTIDEALAAAKVAIENIMK